MTEIYAHRGGAGLYPESTMEAYNNALKIGANVLDVDVAVTKDNVIVASHDLFLNSAFTRDANGNWLRDDSLLIKDFTFAELQQFDVGRLNPHTDYAKAYPEQKPVDGARIPRLQQLVDLGARLQIEIKTNPAQPDLTLVPEAFMRLLNDFLVTNNIAEQTQVHSFDWRNMLALQTMGSQVITSYITSSKDPLLTPETLLAWQAGHDVSQFGGDYPALIAHLGGKVWCPEYCDITTKNVQQAHDLGLKVTTWTVNKVANMARISACAVDGIITDRPDRLASLLAKYD